MKEKGPENRTAGKDTLDRYLEMEQQMGGDAAAELEAEDSATFARCDAVLALTPKLASSPEVGWAFEEAREIAQFGVRPRSQSRWYRRPVLAWSIAGISAAAFAALAVMTVLPIGTSPDDGTDPVNVPAGVDTLLAQIDPVVLIGNQIPVDGRSIVVLPFSTELASADTDDIAAVAAMTDAVYSRLTRQLEAIPGLYVIEPTTAAAYANAGLSPEEIAVYLGVRGVVEGNLASDGQMASLGLRFTDAARDGSAIDQTYSRPIEQMAMIESEVATSLLGALGTASVWGQ